MTSIEPNFASIWLAVIALSGGLVTLIAGGEALISGAVKIADRLGMSPLLIGLTVVAFGTSMPELFVSLNASFSNHSDIMVGNVIGSNIANIGLILAFCAALTPLAIDFQRLRIEFYLLTTAELLVMLIVLLGGFSRAAGIIFTFSLIAYTVIVYWQEARNRRKLQLAACAIQREKKAASYPLIIILILTGLLLMWLGSEYFIKGAVDIARFFGLPELIIGLSIAAIGTSLPELASSISAIRRKSSDILVGNIIGSNLFNLLLVMGLTGVFKPFSIPTQALYRDLPVMLGFTLVLIPLSLGRKKIERWHGITLLASYGIYIFCLN